MSNYLIAAVFCCFTLIIMHTKIDYMKNDCLDLDPVHLDDQMCRARSVSVSIFCNAYTLSYST